MAANQKAFALTNQHSLQRKALHSTLLGNRTYLRVFAIKQKSLHSATVYIILPLRE